MAYTTNHRMTGGKRAQADDFVKLFDNWDVVKRNLAFKAALVYRSSDQTITVGTGRNITWSAEDYDTSGFWSVSNATRLTIPSDVNYCRITFGFRLNAVCTDIDINITKNAGGGAGVPQGSFRIRHQVQSHVMETAVLAVTAGDYYEILLDNNSASSAVFSANYTWACIEGFYRQ